MALKLSTIDISESKVSFSVKKLGFRTVKGTIADFQGSIAFYENDLRSSSFNISISAITIDTGNPKRDEHLKSKDFFFVKNHPQISFKSSAVQKKNNQFLVTGFLTILNQSKEVSMLFMHQNGLLNGNFSLNRLDYDLGKKFPVFIVGKKVQVSINIKTT